MGAVLDAGIVVDSSQLDPAVVVEMDHVHGEDEVQDLVSDLATHQEQAWSVALAGLAGFLAASADLGFLSGLVGGEWLDEKQFLAREVIGVFVYHVSQLTGKTKNGGGGGHGECESEGCGVKGVNYQR